MPEQDIRQIKIKLEKLLADLIDMNSSAKLAAATVDLDQSRVGRVSRIDALQNQAISQSAFNMRAIEISQAKAALSRVDAGDYGFCVVCEEDINPLRLEHNPAVAMCIQCAEAAET